MHWDAYFFYSTIGTEKLYRRWLLQVSVDIMSEALCRRLRRRQLRAQHANIYCYYICDDIHA